MNEALLHVQGDEPATRRVVSVFGLIAQRASVASPNGGNRGASRYAGVFRLVATRCFVMIAKPMLITSSLSPRPFGYPLDFEWSQVSMSGSRFPATALASSLG